MTIIRRLTTLLLGLAFTLVCNAQTPHDGFHVRQTDLDQVCGSFHNFQSAYRVECDYPMGDDACADAVRQWINEKADYWQKGRYNGDMKQPMKLFQHYLKHFTEENSGQKIEEHLVMMSGKSADDVDWNEADDNVEWHYDFTFKKEYASPTIVSYSFAWFGFGVGNATSNADMQDATFDRKSGKQLSWEMFSSREAVEDIIRGLLKEKFGDAADLYENGIPMPKAPLFLADGVRFDYGDYTVGEPHYFEENGTYPSVFIPYSKIDHLLTARAKELVR